MRLALIVEYEGTEYHGFQYQVNARTIQEELEDAIGRLTGEKTRVRAAGRTDAGVHAKGQVVAFDTPSRHSTRTFVKSLNQHLPEAIAVKAAFRTGDDFDPRRMALSREYRYTIDRGSTRSPLTRRTAYRIGAPVDVERMRRAARTYVGRHDFARFAGPLSERGKSTVREVYRTRVGQSGDLAWLDVEGNAFLPHQVRRMAGALLEVGRGDMTPGELRSMVEGAPDSRVAHSLPAHGLCLMKVTYADFPPKAGDANGYD